MTKTIKQIADELGVSKTAIQKKIDNLGLRSSLRKIGNQFAIDEQQETLIKSAFLSKETKTENENQVVDKSESLRLVSSLVDTLKEQLQEKDKQIERLQMEVENFHKLLDQQQQLNAMAEQKILFLEQKQEEDVDVKPKSFWGKIFKKGE